MNAKVVGLLVPIFPAPLRQNRAASSPQPQAATLDCSCPPFVPFTSLAFHLFDDTTAYSPSLLTRCLEISLYRVEEPLKLHSDFCYHCLSLSPRRRSYKRSRLWCSPLSASSPPPKKSKQETLKTLKMSWQGFKKGVNRATTQVLMKTGQVERTNDRDFETELRRFRVLETASNKLQKEAKGYLDSLRGKYMILVSLLFGTPPYMTFGLSSCTFHPRPSTA